MRLDYELNKQDYLNFNIYHSENSETIKHNLKKQIIIPPIAYIVIGLALSLVTEAGFIFLIAFVICSVFWVVFYPAYFKRVVKRNINKMLSEGKNTSLEYKISLSLDDAGIKSVSEKGESSIKWEGIERLSESNEYYFLYITSVSAAIVPKRVFVTDDERKEFIELVKSKTRG